MMAVLSFTLGVEAAEIEPPICSMINLSGNKLISHCGSYPLDSHVGSYKVMEEVIELLCRYLGPGSPTRVDLV